MFVKKICGIAMIIVDGRKGGDRGRDVAGAALQGNMHSGGFYTHDGAGELTAYEGGR